MNIISKIKIQITFSFLLTGLFFFTSCSSVQWMHGTSSEIKGTIKNGRYFSPNENFSCAIPPLAEPGAIIEDSSDTTEDGYVGTVKFEDDYGKLFRVDWYEVSPDIKAHEQKLGKFLYGATMLEGLLTLQMQNFHHVFPQATVEAKETIGDVTNLMLFADVRIPKGATLMQNGQRLDCSRGLFIFSRNNWAYVISIQDVCDDSTALVSIDSDSFHSSKPTMEERKADLKPRLEKFLEGFEFK
jgi:hypothetical protein